MIVEPHSLTDTPPEKTRRLFALCASSALLSIIIVTCAMHLWRANLHVPFSYQAGGHDSFINMMLVKTTIETGWTNSNPLLGAPGQLDQLDFTNPEWLHTGMMRLMSFLFHDFGIVLNLYFLLTFPLIAVTTTIAARQIGLAAITSVMIAQLYTFLPFHFMRGQLHLALGSYYALPLVLPSMLCILRGTAIGRWGWFQALVGFVMVGMSSPYHAIFTGYFLLIAAVAARVGRRDRRAVRSAMLLGSILALAFFVQTVPNFLHARKFGQNTAVGTRLLFEGDVYALRITQMLLPVPGHRIPALAAFRDQYAAHAPLVNENEMSALGIIASWGLLILLFRAIFRRSNQPVPDVREDLIDALAILCLAGFLLATTGGLGPTLNYLGFSTIRGYNRISIFLALFSLVCVGLVLDRFVPPRRRPIIFGIILLIGLLDQISPRIVPDYQQNQRDFASDAGFVARIETALPRGAQVFELPVMAYPESEPVNDLSDYELFRGYLHSSSIHWSYGAMKGREVLRQQQSLLTKPWPAAIVEMRAEHFDGIYLDRKGFKDLATENALQSLLGQPMVSDNQRLVFFPLNPVDPSPNTTVTNH